MPTHVDSARSLSLCYPVTAQYWWCLWWRKFAGCSQEEPKKTHDWTLCNRDSAWYTIDAPLSCHDYEFPASAGGLVRCRPYHISIFRFMRDVSPTSGL